MAIAHYVVIYDTETGEWSVDDGIAEAKFDGRLWFDEGEFRRPADADEEQVDANAYGELFRAVEQLNVVDNNG